MQSSRPTFVLCGLLTVALSTACDNVVDPLDADSLYRDGDDPERGVWIGNGLVDYDVSEIDPNSPLSSSDGLPEDSDLLTNVDHRKTVTYLVECALRDDQTITKVVDGEELTFQGVLGLADEWGEEDGYCDLECQEWVSACMLARTNVSGETVNIWMRSVHPAIGQGTSLAYPAYEASWFGNLFAPEPTRYYCPGIVGPVLAELQGRTCSNEIGESCDFVEYPLCSLQSRCSYGTLLNPTPAADCKSGPEAEGPKFRTISTYVAAL